jgi:hypothetical protein
MHQGPTLDLASIQPVLRTEHALDSDAPLDLPFERVDVSNRLRRLIGQSKTRSDCTDNDNILNCFKELTQNKHDQLPQFDQSLKPLPRDSIPTDVDKINNPLNKDRNESPIRRKRKEVPMNEVIQAQPVPVEVKDSAIQATNQQKTQVSQTEEPVPVEIKDSAIPTTNEQKTQESQTEIIPPTKPT